ATQLANTIDNLGVYDSVSWATVVGIGTLVFTSTTVFITMQNALNTTFRVKAKPEGWNSIFKLIKDRVLSFTFLIGIAFVLLVSLAINALISAFSRQLENWIGELSSFLTGLTALLLPLVIITLLFALIFKYLPDAKLRWKDVLIGGFFTAILFSIGKYLIGFYIGNSQTANLYETAGSVMVIMVWVFFTSIIFLFGAVFTFEHAKYTLGKIPPSDYAVKIVQKEVEVADENAEEEMEAIESQTVAHEVN
ncbi:MAG: YihY/virulence factor BrkB family protein, partial [Bacteroidota bacterium]